LLLSNAVPLTEIDEDSVDAPHTEAPFAILTEFVIDKPPPTVPELIVDTMDPPMICSTILTLFPQANEDDTEKPRQSLVSPDPESIPLKIKSEPVDRVAVKDAPSDTVRLEPIRACPEQVTWLPMRATDPQDALDPISMFWHIVVPDPIQTRDTAESELPKLPDPMTDNASLKSTWSPTVRRPDNKLLLPTRK